MYMNSNSYIFQLRRQAVKFFCLTALVLLTVQCTDSDWTDHADSPKIIPQLVAEFTPLQSMQSSRIVTSEDGEVNWEATDQLKSFIVAHSNTNWENNGYRFVTNETDMKKNIFKASSDNVPHLQADKSYDWYVMSPYSAQVADPVGGSESGTEFSFQGQVQDGKNPMAHLTRYDIMTGAAENVPATQNPSIQLKHKAVLMKFTIVNNQSETLELRNIEFVASKDVYIGGTYSIGFGEDGILFPKEASHITTLRFKNVEPLAPGQRYDAYIVMPAFTLTQGSKFTVRVYTDKGTAEQTMAASDDIRFTAGTINTAQFKIDQLNPVFFAKGVTLHSGWYDVNKKGDGRTEIGDAAMCWAAASANMLEWWQDRYKDVHGSLPPKAVTGKGENYELAIFELFHTLWDNSEYGSEVSYGIPWYFTGRDIAKEINAQYVARPLSPGTGGYFSNEWPEIEPVMGDNYVYYVQYYYNWGPGGDTGRSELDIFTELVKDAINHGMASLSISVGQVMHAITLWGYELNENGLLKKVYVTDSDDLIKTPKAPRVQLMQEYEVTTRGDREVGIVRAYDPYNMFSQIVPFKGYFVDNF